MTEWLVWLESLSPVTALRGSTVLYPVVNALHIIGIGLLLGTIVTVDIRIIGLWQAERWRQGLYELLPLARLGFALAVASGGLLFSIRATEYIANPALQLKLVLIAIALLNVMAFHVLWRRSDTDAMPAAGLRISAGLSLVLWLASIFAGRAIGFL
jgi:hypothetical protein